MSRNRNNARRTPKSNPRGVLRVHPEGYGFVLTAEGEFYVASSAMKGAFDGDLVEVAPLKPVGKKGDDERHGSGRLPERRGAKVVQVLDRAHASIVGRVEVAEPFAIVIPADPHITHDIFTMRAEAPDVPEGAIVRVTMVTYPDRNSAATGVITEVISGSEDAAAIDMILARYHLDKPFAPEVLEEAEAQRLDVEGALRRGYRDLRDRLVFTIDPTDAKDYDDAVSCEPLDHGCYRVGVHIADVSAYVAWDGALDTEARMRGTSVYAVDRVIPMLPEALSNDLCSLVAGQPRLTMTVDMVVDGQGKVKSADIYPAVIQSAARLTYDEAQAVITDSGKGSQDVSAEVAQTILQLHKIAKKRLALAEARGALDFNRAEAKVKLDASGAPVDVVLRRKTDATSLIEECMIMANEAVATFLGERQTPGAFRVHEAPDAVSLDALVPTFARFAWFADIDRELFVMGDHRTLARVLTLAQGSAQAEVATMLLLRAMKRACYRASDDGHYGLALEHYAHFTSPIRRYPDLLVHRAVKCALGMGDGHAEARNAALATMCAHSSQMETVAEDAARETQEYKLIEYLQRFVGQTFPGVISGVTARCVYVRLENTAEGMVSFGDLGHEYFSYDATEQLLLGESTGKVYRLGDTLRVTITEANPKTRTLRFKPAK